MIDLERKLLTDKGNLQKVSQPASQPDEAVAACC